MSARPPIYLPASLPVRPPTCLLPCLPARLPASLPARLPATSRHCHDGVFSLGGSTPVSSANVCSCQLGCALLCCAVLQGKEIVDIREEWSEEVHGTGGLPAGLSASQQPAAPHLRQLAGANAAAAAHGGSVSAGHWHAERKGGVHEEDWGQAGGAGGSGPASPSYSAASADSFEALMQRMEALEMDEAALTQAAAAGAVGIDEAAAEEDEVEDAASAAAPARAAQGAAGAGSGGPQAASASVAQKQGASSSKGPRGSSSGFKSGFLLGKQLDSGTPSAAKAVPSRQREQQPGQGQAGELLQRRQQEEEAAAAAARRRAAAFTGMVVERPTSGPAPDPASPTAQASLAAAGPAGLQPFSGVSVDAQPSAVDDNTPSQQPPRVSRFKLRRAGI